MPRPSLAKLHPHLARVGIGRSLNTLTINFQKTTQTKMIAPKRSAMHRPIISTTPLPHPVAPPHMTQGRRGRYFERRYMKANVAAASTCAGVHNIETTRTKPTREAQVHARKDSILRELGIRNTIKPHDLSRLYTRARNTSTNTKRVSVLQIGASNQEDVIMPNANYSKANANKNHDYGPVEDNLDEIYNFYYPNAAIHLNEPRNTAMSVASQYEIKQTKKLVSTDVAIQNEQSGSSLNTFSKSDNNPNHCWICHHNANRNQINFPYHGPPTTPSVQQGCEGAMTFRYSTPVEVPSWLSRKDAIFDALVARHSTGNMTLLAHKKLSNDMRTRHQLIMEQHKQSIARGYRKSSTPALNVRNTRPQCEGFSDMHHSQLRLFSEKTSLILQEKHKELDLKAILAVQKSNHPTPLQNSSNIHNKSFLPPLRGKSKHTNDVKLQPSMYIGYDDIHRSASSSSELYNRQLAASTHACYAQIIEALPQSNSYILTKFLDECNLDNKLSENDLEALQADLDAVFINKREHNSHQKIHHKSSTHKQSHIPHDQKPSHRSFDIVIPICEILPDREATQASSNLSDINHTCGNNKQTPEIIVQYSDLPKRITDNNNKFSVNDHAANDDAVVLPIVPMNIDDHNNESERGIIRDNNCTTKVCIPEIRMIAATPLPPTSP